MSGYLACEAHGEAFTKACSTCVYEAGIKLAQACRSESESLYKERDALLLQIDALKAQDDVRTGRWCNGNMAEGRGPCGVCPKCSKANFDRAEIAEIQLKESNRLLREVEPLIGAARLMVKHQRDRHELSACCHDVTPTNAYLLERALKEWDETQRPINDFAANQQDNLRECENCHHTSADHDAKGRRCTAVLDGGGGCGCRGFAEKRLCPSTYTHTTYGKLLCEKDEAHLHRRGDVEHSRDGVKWMSV